MKINYWSVIAVVIVAMSCTNRNTGATDSFNEAASVTAKDSIAVNPLEWKVICLLIDKNAKTMSTLYGNDIAVSHARVGGRGNYPAGAQLSLVTWKQKEDGHWFGGNIPDSIQTIENVNFELPKETPAYTLRKGSPLKIDTNSSNEFATARIEFISWQTQSVIP